MDVQATLEGFSQTWSSGSEVIDVKLTLGQNEKSSVCTLTLADPGHVIAAALINHSLVKGGIVALPDSQQQPESGIVPTGFVLEGSAVLSPLRQAFLDTIAFAEGTYNQPESGYKTIVGYTQFTSYADHPRVYVADANSTAAGRYQFLDTSWDLAKKALKLPDFSPASQDKAALREIQAKGALSSVDNGNFEAAVTACRRVWASFPKAGHGQLEHSMSKLKAFYNQRLVALGVNPGLPNLTKEPPKATKEVASANTPVTEMVKGNKLNITVAETVFEFYHQGTEALHDGKTTLTGQGIRWVLRRRKRNKTLGQTTLKQLSTKIAAAHKVRLNYLAPLDLTYQHLDQTGISDYELLLRECRQAGLFVSESNGVMTIKALANIEDSQFVVAEGLNLIAWSIKDQALGSSSESEGSSLLQTESKVTINPITGQFEQSMPDIDLVKDESVTGKPADPPKGALEPGQAAIATQNRARVKRVKGLPSVFTVVLTPATLGLKPLDAIRTTGLPEVLSRVWLVDAVSHEVAAGKTTLSCYSPIEVLDTTPQPQNTPSNTKASVTTLNPGKFIVPCHGVVTSTVGKRKAPTAGASTLHKGTDIGVPLGTPIVASLGGVVVFSGFSGGAGLLITLQHDGGYQSLYMHNSKLIARQGQQVQQGETIALAGNTGTGTGVHCHFEVRKNGIYQHPRDFGLPQLANKGDRV